MLNSTEQFVVLFFTRQEISEFFNDHCPIDRDFLEKDDERLTSEFCQEYANNCRLLLTKNLSNEDRVAEDTAVIKRMWRRL